MVKFDEKRALVEASLIRFFRKDFRPSIRAQMEPRSEEYDSWDDLVEKTIAAEAKASLQPFYYSCNIDNRCPKGNRPSHMTLLKPKLGQKSYGKSLEKAQTHQAQKS